MQLHRQIGARLRRFRVAQSLELREIGAGTEAGSRAGQDDATHAVFAVGGAQRLEQRARQRRIERVALLRPVERQDADRAFVLCQQVHSDARRRRASSVSATSRRKSSPAGTMSCTRPALWPASTLPHSTSPRNAACLSEYSWNRVSSSARLAPARSAASYFLLKAVFRGSVGVAPAPTPAGLLRPGAGSGR